MVVLSTMVRAVRRFTSGTDFSGNVADDVVEIDLTNAVLS
jgi:hypothetical protein